MKVLAYEHITGGAVPDGAQLAALAPEGEAMLRALVDDLTAISDVEVFIMRDARLSRDLPVLLHSVDAASAFWPVFRRALRDADAVWPIVPERDGVLLRITQEILQAGRTLLGCRPDAVGVATSKHATFEVLARAGITAIPSYSNETSIPEEFHEIVVKPDDGAGCQDTLLFRNRARLQAWLRSHGTTGLVFQPYVRGDARSLSLLCCDGRARLLACNRQKVGVAADRFVFSGVSVGAVADDGGRYAKLASAIARSMPGLWGYCGVDFIETGTGPIVLEVNPRLTTSYAGLHGACGINPAQLVLELPASLEAAGGMTPPMRAVEVQIGHAG